jgi:hypothetical protein
MLIRFPEQNFNNFIVPAFQINEGEIVVIELPGGALFHPLLFEIKNMLTGAVTDSAVEINSDFKFVEHFKESFFNYHFSPTTVNNYHQKYANKHKLIYQKIYDTPWLKKQTKVNTLAGTMRKKLALYTTLSWTNRLIFDLIGVDPNGAAEVFDIVKQAIMPNGAAIIIDGCDEFKNQCTTFVKVDYVGENIRSEKLKFTLKSKSI